MKKDKIQSANHIRSTEDPLKVFKPSKRNEAKCQLFSVAAFSDFHSRRKYLCKQRHNNAFVRHLSINHIDRSLIEWWFSRYWCSLYCIDRFCRGKRISWGIIIFLFSICLRKREKKFIWFSKDQIIPYKSSSFLRIRMTKMKNPIGEMLSKKEKKKKYTYGVLKTIFTKVRDTKERISVERSEI